MKGMGLKWFGRWKRDNGEVEGISGQIYRSK
jgi:hypothetical protein